MEIVNETPFEFGLGPAYAPGLPRAITIVIKATFEIRTGEPPVLATEQDPVVVADEYYEGTDYQAVRLESEMAPFKPRADIIVVGQAHAPNGKPVTALMVSVRVGEICKKVAVIGDRHWQRSRLLGEPKMSDPEPFVTMDLVADRAFGGWGKRDWCLENPIGCGFVDKPDNKAVEGLPLPNIEDPTNPILSWHTHPAPTGLGVYPNNAFPRMAYAGRYPEDHEPVESNEPQFPPGFRLDFFNAAHRDLQVDGYLSGDEEIELLNLSPEGDLRFRLPGINPAVEVERLIDPPAADEEEDQWAAGAIPVAAEDESEEEDEDLDPEDEPKPETTKETVDLNLDTLCLCPDEKRFTLAWRGLIEVRDYEGFADELLYLKILASGCKEGDGPGFRALDSVAT